MNNQEIFIIIVIGILAIFKIVNLHEDFSTINDFPCDKNPLNSNCTCPANAPQKVVIGEFPMNYGEKSPYVYTCVPAKAQEPPTTLWTLDKTLDK